MFKKCHLLPPQGGEGAVSCGVSDSVCVVVVLTLMPTVNSGL